MKTNVKRATILFLYDGKYYIPNGDPFTKEQRFDTVTDKVLVSDVRIKRYARDYLLDCNMFCNPKDMKHVYVQDIPDEILQELKIKKGTSAAARTRWLQKTFPGVTNVKELLCKCLDVRWFGGISTSSSKDGGDEDEGEGGKKLEGPIQFAELNPSLNTVIPMDHQNTSVFKSDINKGQGAIGTTSLIPYSVNQIIGWVNPASALATGLTEEEVISMLNCIWEGVNTKNTRTKCNQSSLLVMKINYQGPMDSPDQVDDLITIKSEKPQTSIRSLHDYTLDFSKIAALLKSPRIASVDYRCTNPILSKSFDEAMAPVKGKLKSF